MIALLSQWVVEGQASPHEARYDQQQGQLRGPGGREVRVPGGVEEYPHQDQQGCPCVVLIQLRTMCSFLYEAERTHLFTVHDHPATH